MNQKLCLKFCYGFFTGILTLIISSPSEAQTCSERQLKMDLLRTEVNQGNYIFLNNSLRLPDNFISLRPMINIPFATEINSNPLRDLPSFPYNINFNVAEEAKERILDCGTSSFPLLKNILLDKTIDRNLRIKIPFFLKQLAPDQNQIIPVLSSVIKDNSEVYELRSISLVYLTEIDHPEVRNLLINLLRYDISLGKSTVVDLIKFKKYASELIPPLISTVLFEDLNANSYSPYYAVQVLAEIGDNSDQVIRVLTEVLNREDTTLDLKIYVASALLKLQTNSTLAIEFLTNTMKDNTLEINKRKNAGFALAQNAPVSLANINFFNDLWRSNEIESWEKSGIENTLVMMAFKLENNPNYVSSQELQSIIDILSNFVDDLSNVYSSSYDYGTPPIVNNLRTSLEVLKMTRL
jgi:hypothetical protein